MKINKDKRIGQVLFIVEGGRYEFNLLKKIFVDIFHFEYIEKRRNKPDYFISGSDKFSRVAVINTKDSNIKDISDNQDYLDGLYLMLQEKYNYPVENSAIYYLFDRDPESNTDKNRINFYIENLKDSYENENYYLAGQLLLSYPSIESYTISSFSSNVSNLRFNLGKEAKNYISCSKEIQLNKIDENALIIAADRFKEFVSERFEEYDIDNFENVNKSIFEEQEIEYFEGRGYRLFSMLTLCFLQLGLIED